MREFTPEQYREAYSRIVADLCSERRGSRRVMLGMGAVIVAEFLIIAWLAVSR